MPSASGILEKVKFQNLRNFSSNDRAGLGRSERDDRPKDSKQSVENLSSLLQNANIKPPYMLVGHSFGGANVRLYACTFQKK